MRLKVFRWKAVGPLLVFAGVGVLLWLLFADRIARLTAEDVGTQVVGAQVEIKDLHIDLAAGDVTIRGLSIGDPHEPFRNLLEADELVADLDVVPLLEKKVVIDRLAAKGLKFGTARATPGTVAGADARSGAAGRILEEARTWGRQLEVPALQLVTGDVDVGRLDPARLATPAAAVALTARADSSRQAWDRAVQGLNLAATVDSLERMVQRLRDARATDLAALAEARRALDQAKRARDRLAAVERDVAGGATALQAGLAALSDAKQRDYGFARSLVRLPSLDAPEIGAALFAPAAVARFERALYWAQLARHYMPPGLLPRADAGPKRTRARGTTVRFPRERAYPEFLLRAAELSFVLGAASDRPPPRAYAARLTGLTSSPALYGRPTTLEASAPALRIGALADHVRDTPRDTAAATLQGVALPGFALPSLPVRLEPGTGAVTLSFALSGDQIRARWGVRSDAVRWVRDSIAPAGGADLGQLVWRVLSGVQTLDLAAEVSGTLARPHLSVRSNLDRVLAERLRAVVGEEVAVAERRLRAEVDRVVEPQAAPARARANAVTSEARARVAVQRGNLNAAQKALEQRLRELTRGIRLP